MGRSKFRLSFFRLHAFFGLHVFAILALTFFSGSVLTFVWEIESSLNKDIRLAEPAQSHDAEFGQIFDNIRAFDPKLRPVIIHRAETLWVDDRTVAQWPNGRKVNVWSHPQSAEILGITSSSGLRKFFFEYHASMMTGHRIGGIIASGMSILLLSFLVTGLVTYPRFWRGLFRAPPRHLGSRAWWAGLHRLIAVWILPVSAGDGAHGILLFFRQRQVDFGKIPPGRAGFKPGKYVSSRFLTAPPWSAPSTSPATRCPGLK